MLRMFCEHEIRLTESLDGIWDLRLPDGRQYKTAVPGVWETIPDLASYQGKADYEREVVTGYDSDILLRFGGVSHTAKVFFDGVKAGSHYNAYTGFSVLIKDVKAGVHKLTVKVDDSFGPESALHIPNDYNTYGGINRSVCLEYVDGAYISSISFYSEENEDGTFNAHVKAEITALKDIEEAGFTAFIAGRSVSTDISGLKKDGTKSVSVTVKDLDVTRWDVLDGNLYDLAGVLDVDGQAVDDLIDRVGFRTVELDGQKILINHREIKIKGFNRHEDHGQLGLSMDAGTMMCDLQLMLDMGANSVRTCHYPNDPKFLDLCDELGILVWEEDHARALPREILESDVFKKQISDCNIEMITQHVNHPSIYIWGVLNECESETEFGYSVYRTNLEQLRDLDPTRPVSFASCRHFNDVCLDLADVVSFNIYPAWYLKEPVSDFLIRLLKWIDEDGNKDKPVLITEIGAGAIAGYHDTFRRAKWSEERQADIIREQLTAVLDNKRISGVYVWQFADVRVSEEWFANRPRTMNNKGVVDEMRRPKLAYAVVKEIYGRNRYN